MNASISAGGTADESPEFARGRRGGGNLLVALPPMMQSPAQPRHLGLRILQVQLLADIAEEEHSSP